MPEFFKTDEERQRVNASLLRVDSAPAKISDEILHLAKQLSAIHGRIHVANEASGLHLYMASPACLELDGASELDKRHLAANAVKYMAGEDMAGACMKTGTPYNVLALLSMQPLDKRGYELKSEVVQSAAVNPEYLEPDANGNMIPKSPGITVPAYTLSADHPARIYLRSRNFCPYKLWAQFRLSWCEKERDDMFYRKLLGGFRATSQNRLIFNIEINGVRRGWQARILEMDEDGALAQALDKKLINNLPQKSARIVYDC